MLHSCDAGEQSVITYYPPIFGMERHNQDRNDLNNKKNIYANGDLIKLDEGPLIAMRLYNFEGPSIPNVARRNIINN